MEPRHLLGIIMSFWMVVLVAISLMILLPMPVITAQLSLVWTMSGLISAIVMAVVVCKPKKLSDLGLYFMAFLTGPYVILVVLTAFAMKPLIRVR